MKKLIFILAIFILCGSCETKEDRIFDKRPGERTAELIEEYKQLLMSAPNGWLLSVDTKVNGGYRHWVAFDANNRVSMLSDMDATFSGVSTSQTPKESSWILVSDILPILSFDSYNYLHILADPQGKPGHGRPGNGGENGEGLISDFEFYIVGIQNGVLSMKGRYNGCNVRLTPATAAEAQAAITGGLKTIHDKTWNTISSNTFILGNINGTETVFTVTTRKITASRMGETEGGRIGVVESSAGGYLDFSSIVDGAESSNMILFEPLPIGGVYIVALEWDGVRYNAVTSTGTSIPLEFVSESPLPLEIGYRRSYTQMDITDNLPGTQDAAFLSQVYLKSVNEFNTRRSPRSVKDIIFVFGMDPASEIHTATLKFTYYTDQTLSSTYTGNWRYKTTLNDDGTMTFYDRDQSGSSNEYSNEAYIKPLLNYFCDVQYSTEPASGNTSGVKSSVTPRTFKVDWVQNKTMGSTSPAGGLVPIYDAGNTSTYFVDAPCIGALTK